MLPVSPYKSHHRSLHLLPTQYTTRAPTRNYAQPKRITTSSSESSKNLGSVLGSLALTGATTGTFLDGIHSKVGVIHYDIMPVSLSGLQTSVLVPPLLSAFYLTLGAITLYADSKMKNDPVTMASLENACLSRTAASFAALAFMLELSSFLYSNGTASNVICLVLAGFAFLNYLIFDSSKQGLALAVLCALGAPAIEVVLMQSLHVWHYQDADFFGMPRWVPFCYFFYPPAVIQFTRYLWKSM